MQPLLINIALIIILGRRLMFQNLKAELLMVIIVQTVKWGQQIIGCLFRLFFVKTEILDVIREALHNELGYAVTEKYKSYTHQLVEAYQNGTDISSLSAPLSFEGVKNNRPFKNIDGIKFLNHQGGCGGIRQDAAVLSKLLAAYADHPNVAGVTVLSLGCQNLQVQDFTKDLKIEIQISINHFSFLSSSNRRAKKI
jgi:hypothetical protein